MSKPPLISALPAEILLPIFDFACLTANVARWKAEDPWTALLLSHVCSTWRQIMLSTSRHWSTIHMINGILPEDMLLEYARRARRQTLSFRTLGERKNGYPEWLVPHPVSSMSIPRAISKEISTIVLTHPAHLNWLRFDGDGEKLTVLYLGSHIPDSSYRNQGPFIFPFDLINVPRFFFDTTSIICDRSVVISGDTSLSLLFLKLRSILFEGVDVDDIDETMDAIEAPRLVSLHCKNLVYAPWLGSASEHIKGIYSRLRYLNVVGDADTFIVVQNLLRGVASPRLEKLELKTLLVRSFSRVNFGIWASYASHVRCISLTVQAHECASILDAFAEHQFDRLECLQLRLADYDSSYAVDLSRAYCCLERFLASHRGPRLKKLDISSILLYGKNAADVGLRSMVGVLRFDEFDAEEYDPSEESDEEADT